MRFLFNVVSMVAYFVVFAVAVSAPILVVVWLGRRRLRPLVARLLVACSFAAAASYMLWRMEWFDVWRYGAPPIGYVLAGYAPWVIAFAGVGWALGALLSRGRRLPD
jgi:hypothetical protein